MVIFAHNSAYNASVYLYLSVNRSESMDLTWHQGSSIIIMNAPFPMHLKRILFENLIGTESVPQIGMSQTDQHGRSLSLHFRHASTDNSEVYNQI